MISKEKSIIKKYIPTFLSISASAGVIATASLTAKATSAAYKKTYSNRKENEEADICSTKELVTSCWKFYIPAAGVAITTIGCILGSNYLNGKQQAAILAGYSLLQNNYKDYQNKLKELYGQEAHETIMSEIVKDKCDFKGIGTCGFLNNSTLGIDTKSPDEVRTFYDSYSKRYFDSTLSDVIQAEYHLNRNFVIGGEVAVNDYYNFIGLDEIEGGNLFGWSMNDEIYWIDFNHYVSTLDDGMEIVVIDMEFNPSKIEY